MKKLRRKQDSMLGRHILADLYDITPSLLRDPRALCDVLTKAAHASGAHVLNSHFHHFGGDKGVTGVVLLSESHITIHTWPEHGYAALDIFMCGQTRPEPALEYVNQALAPVRIGARAISRGDGHA